MPLVRAEVRNEYALGAQELYKEANKEDPKEVLEGVAVAGLVGVLRQLGDLAEFAAEIFLGLQEEAMRTSSRSHKLMDRVKRIETLLSPLEKALLAQRSHLHFAYTAGSNWHVRISCEQNHFIYSDMPQFMLDSYYDIPGPPSLHLLDKFDPLGPGSCMKRYSDPTFFKRVSVASTEPITYKASKDKKGRKIKKRPRTRSQQLSRDASFAHRSGRMLHTQANIDRHHSSSRTASTYDAAQGSDFNEQTTFTLRNASDYTEGYFQPSNPTQPDEQKSRKSISSSCKRRENDFLDYNFLDGKIIDACDDFHVYTSREPASYSSSSGSWNEKSNSTDVRSMERKTKNSENNCMTPGNNNTRHLESFSPVLNDESPVCKADDIEIVNDVDSQPHNHDVKAPESADALLNVIDSEADHYVDALNTIESEGETDTDCMKKKKVEHYPELEDKAVKEVSEVVRHDAECQTSSSDTNILAESSLINGSCDNNSTSLSPKSHLTTKSNADVFDSIFLVDKDLQSSQVAKANVCDTGEDSFPCIISSTVMDDQPPVSITNGPRIGLNSQKQVQETSNVTSVTFWSNGDLLGLQPSKPLDFRMLSSHQGHLLETEGQIGSSTPHIIHRDKAASQTEIIKHTEENLCADSSMSHENEVSSPSVTKTLWKIPTTDLDIKLGKLVGDPVHQKNNSDITTGSTENSSRKSELSNMWLSSGDNKRLLLGENNRNSVAHHIMNSLEQKNCLAVTNHILRGQNKDPFSGESFIMSPSTSPPLAHMKLSFQPIDGFETLKLKLKFPDGSTESGSDIVTSFQLVPEVSIALPNFGSDSDADTFYRSSPSLSDDGHRNRWSESNSEQWESNESSTGKDCDIYDTLRRISVSSVVENGHEEFPFVENMSDNTGCCPFDSAISSPLGNELKNDIWSLKGVVGPQQFVVMPASPPLPPIQWQKSVTSAEGSHYEFSLTNSRNNVSQPKPAPLSDDPIDTMQMQKSKLSSLWESNGRREQTNQVRSVDEKDFLHQIRAKSFNLKPTVTTNPAVLTVPSPSVQVTAIIEKANAIRQAVASDGDDDGNWSET